MYVYFLKIVQQAKLVIPQQIYAQIYALHHKAHSLMTLCLISAYKIVQSTIQSYISQIQQIDFVVIHAHLTISVIIGHKLVNYNV